MIHSKWGHILWHKNAQKNILARLMLKIFLENITDDWEKNQNTSGRRSQIMKELVVINESNKMKSTYF